VPVDARSGGVPAELTTIHDGALAIAEAAQTGDWDTASTMHIAVVDAWRAYQSSVEAPSRLGDQMDRALAALDLELQFRPATDVDRQRFEVWARQLVIDANRLEANPGFVAADVTTLEWILPRFGETLDEAMLADLEGHLVDLRTAADEEDVTMAAKLGAELVDSIATAG
jgi:hypothetical protein